MTSRNIISPQDRVSFLIRPAQKNVVPLRRLLLRRIGISRFSIFPKFSLRPLIAYVVSERVLWIDLLGLTIPSAVHLVKVHVPSVRERRACFHVLDIVLRSGGVVVGHIGIEDWIGELCGISCEDGILCFYASLCWWILKDRPVWFCDCRAVDALDVLLTANGGTIELLHMLQLFMRCATSEDLWLHQNELTGSIPKEMSLLSKLAFLVIENNKLTGGIPPFVGNITSMEVFSVKKNPLGGSIPDTLGNLSDQSAIYIWRHINYLEAFLHSIGNVDLAEGGFRSFIKESDSVDDRLVCSLCQMDCGLRVLLAWAKNITNSTLLHIEAPLQHYKDRRYGGLCWRFPGSCSILVTDLNQTAQPGVKEQVGLCTPGYYKLITHDADYYTYRLPGGNELTVFNVTRVLVSGDEILCCRVRDVYSFGILLLEVMTGKKPTDDMFNEGLSIHKFAPWHYQIM
ncbi:kinase-like domain-containing protein [Tanacetum coccineum]